jgi:hypothetical protein
MPPSATCSSAFCTVRYNVGLPVCFVAAASFMDDDNFHESLSLKISIHHKLRWCCLCTMHGGTPCTYPDSPSRTKQITQRRAFFVDMLRQLLLSEITTSHSRARGVSEKGANRGERTRDSEITPRASYEKYICIFVRIMSLYLIGNLQKCHLLAAHR